MPTLISLIAAIELASATSSPVKTGEGVHSQLHGLLSTAGFSLITKNQKGQAKYTHPKTGDKVHTNLAGMWHMRPGTSYTSRRGMSVASLHSALRQRKYSVAAGAVKA